MSTKQQTDSEVMLDWNANSCASSIINSGYLSSADEGSGLWIHSYLAVDYTNEIFFNSSLPRVHLFSKSNGQSTYYALEGGKVVIDPVMILGSSRVHSRAYLDNTPSKTASVL